MNLVHHNLLIYSNIQLSLALLFSPSCGQDLEGDPGGRGREGRGGAESRPRAGLHLAAHTSVRGYPFGLGQDCISRSGPVCASRMGTTLPRAGRTQGGGFACSRWRRQGYNARVRVSTVVCEEGPYCMPLFLFHTCSILVLNASLSPCPHLEISSTGSSTPTLAKRPPRALHGAVLPVPPRGST